MKKFLIVGLGNPGRKYQDTRHNVGFWVIDRAALEAGLAFSEEKSAPKYLLAQGHFWDAKIFLLKPMEFMNRSGGPVQRVASYYDIAPQSLLVVHDDLDVPFGKMKFVRSGGHGGHNGIRSIIDALGTKQFPRLKIGIGRPPGGMPADRFVLGRFSKDELEVIDKVVDFAVRGIEEFVKNGIDSAMNKFNGLEVADI
ncbi:MAG: aminoacyl-tRNA hydrolase [Thermodesulfobacteria bacterium]|nr:aminoacyl-tRNA hydrolase [Thermodesulfobacteriota bacterium]